MLFKSLPLSAFFASLCLGCASSPPEPPLPVPSTAVNLQITADALINPDAGNKASPVLLRVYELKEQSNFVNADFFAVFEKENPTLSTDLLHKQEMLIKPGEILNLPFEADPKTKQIGFFAAFRNLENAQWRAILPLDLHKNNEIQLKIGVNALSATVPKPPPPAAEANPPEEK